MRYYYLVAPTTVVRADESAFTYHSDSILATGTLVRVSVGKRLVNGVVVTSLRDKPSFTTKEIGQVLTTRPLPLPLMELAKWLSEYYSTHFALALQTILPSGLHKQRRAQKVIQHPIRKRTKIVLNKDQQRAIQLINQRTEGTILLHGVTGSGKTQIYIEAAKTQARHGKSTIILVPEIALTPQLVAEFANHFSRLIVTHSAMTEAQRHLAWAAALEADGEPLVIIGPRSALFTPINNLGLIVVDECHEPSYKQEQSPRYSALRAASILARLHGQAKVILGSATPSVTDYYIAQTNKSPIIRLSQPVVTVHTPNISVVDYKNRQSFKRHRFISNELLDAIDAAISKKQQVLIFHNRRGTAPTTMCESCGWIANCPTCFVPLTLHADAHELRCHLCGFRQNVPPSCPVCREPTITFKGIGTKIIESEIIKLFPKANVARFDADTTAEDALHKRYQELYDGSIDILIGTQILAKGLDLPNLSVVGVIQADSGLVIPDYTSEERVFQLLYQVIGRVGRGEHNGSVVIQTYQPDHPVLIAALARDYRTFYQAELARRERGRFPPFRYLLKITCGYKTEKGAVDASQKLATALRRSHPNLEILGPTPAFYERLGGAYRWQLVIKSKQRGELSTLIHQLPPNWQFDIDPASLL